MYNSDHFTAVVRLNHCTLCEQLVAEKWRPTSSVEWMQMLPLFQQEKICFS